MPNGYSILSKQHESLKALNVNYAKSHENQEQIWVRSAQNWSSLPIDHWDLFM